MNASVMVRVSAPDARQKIAASVTFFTTKLGSTVCSASGVIIATDSAASETAGFSLMGACSSPSSPNA